MENLAGYITRGALAAQAPGAAGAPALRVRASFSQERMTYTRKESKVIYQSKDGKEEKVFDALEWLAVMCSHVPDKGESR